MNKLSIQFTCIPPYVFLLAPSFCLWIHIRVVGLENVQHMQSEWRIINFNVCLNILANGVGVLIVFVTGVAFY
jgi:hypothetical protein